MDQGRSLGLKLEDKSNQYDVQGTWRSSTPARDLVSTFILHFIKLIESTISRHGLDIRYIHSEMNKT